jgi:hypothetical protein
LSAANDDRRPGAGEPPALAGEELCDVLKRKMTLALTKMKTRPPWIVDYRQRLSQKDSAEFNECSRRPAVRRD